MSLIETVKAGIETAFAVGAEFVTVGEYLKKTGNGTYDPVADTITPGANIVSGVRFLKTSAGVQEREASPVAINDVKFLVPAIDLPGLEPGENDQIRILGIRYNVVVTKFVPGNVIHIIFGRRA